MATLGNTYVADFEIFFEDKKFYIQQQPLDGESAHGTLQVRIYEKNDVLYFDAASYTDALREGLAETYTQGEIYARMCQKKNQSLFFQLRMVEIIPDQLELLWFI